jgi:tRNA threonylcarbamoyladenosine biosynthesis protein TsaB
MALILSIETSTSVCSAALHQNGELLAAEQTYVPQSAAAQLAVQIDQLFLKSRVRKNQLQAVAVSSGPGSYTGLRIGVATAKGICFGLHLPLITIDSLSILASGITAKADLLCPMIDARRMEVYCALLDHSLAFIENMQAKIIDEQSFSELLKTRYILFFGDGAAKCKGVIQSPNAKFLEDAFPLASDMGPLAFQKFKLNAFADSSTSEPNYLKDFNVKTKMA